MVLCMVACGGGDGSSSVAITDFATQFPDALCTKAFKCCTQVELSMLFDSSTTLTTTTQCDTYEETLFGFSVTRINASVTAGRVTYDADAAGACLGAISGASCTDFDHDATTPNAPPSCAPFLVAKVAVGGGCTQNYECTTGYCKGAVTTPTPMDGMCAAVPTMGQACESTCAAGLYCDFMSLTCQAVKADGSACAMGDECMSGGCTGGVCGLLCSG